MTQEFEPPAEPIRTVFNFMTNTDALIALEIAREALQVTEELGRPETVEISFDNEGEKPVLIIEAAGSQYAEALAMSLNQGGITFSFSS